MTQEKFDTIYQRAAHRKGGAAELEKIVRAPLSQAELSQITDDRWLAAFTEKVFQCGISWNVVRKKWPQFEEVFFEFNIEKMLMLPNEMWDYLKKHGKRLGGNTGAYTLRQMGKDTFILSSDVEAHLRSTDVVDSGRNTKRAQLAAGKAFNEWQQQSGRSLSEISQIVAYSCGDNRV
ncbi:DNA-3-methyladenine glycosylase I [Vibrio lentus]|uniref:3-methyladenine DNA glycosylase n=1 Tax=Vibrio lentus TaxID=136468 RepID=A0A2N7K0T6_9VIBR|nr:3-methyladenine DNA glycosylase [Vibrio lentus]PMM66762.1 3-methyladenine DNA glycosylase [Vibrio lentus]